MTPAKLPEIQLRIVRVDSSTLHPSTKIFKAFECSTCYRKYAMESSLQRHIMYECKKNPTSILCYHCKISFTDKSSLDDHIKLNHPTTVSTSKANLVAEKKPKTYTCADCGKSFKRKSNMMYHANTDCEKKPSFFCQYCDYSCKRGWNLFRHVKNQHSVILEKL